MTHLQVQLQLLPCGRRCRRPRSGGSGGLGKGAPQLRRRCTGGRSCLRDARQHAHAAALAVRDELSDVEVRRGRAQQEFAEELKAQAELAREKQRLQMARRLARGEGDAHAALRSSLFLSEGGVANEASPPANVPPTAWSAAVQAAAQATGVAGERSTAPHPTRASRH